MVGLLKNNGPVAWVTRRPSRPTAMEELMKYKVKWRTAISGAVMLAIVSVFSLGSFASSESNPAVGLIPANAVSSSPAASVGRLIGSGIITIDDYLARSGATVLSGSTIATGSDGEARIELGALGQVQMRPNARVKLTYGSGEVNLEVAGEGSVVERLSAGVEGRISVSGSGSRLRVLEGGMKVSTKEGVREVSTGEEYSFEKGEEVSLSGEAVFALDSDSNVASASQASQTASNSNFITAGWPGILAITGVAAAVAIGIALGANDDDDDAPIPSPIVP